MPRKRKTDHTAYAWDQSLDRLRTFKASHGHCNVPVKYLTDRRLGIWVHNQRRFWREGSLGVDRTARLTALGFEWNAKDARWAKMLSELECFMQTESGPVMPARWNGNRELERWVFEQRRLYRTGQLKTGRLQRLEQIGFTWSEQDAVWEQMFSTLLGYKKRYGDCDVPRRWPENPALGNWVVLHRSLGKKAKIPPDRVARLTEAGFRW